MPSFLVREGPLGRGWLEVESQVVLGRGAADVVIDDPEISRRHALVRVVGGAVEIHDLDSLNGTWVNGQRIARTTQLRPGDVVRLGKSVLELEAQRPQPMVPDEPAPAVPIAAPAPTGRCPECDAELPSSARFCSYCGAPQQATPSVAPPVLASDRGEINDAPKPAAALKSVQVEDELRPVTALFADVVGSTALGERLAPDEVKTLIGECVTRMSRAVEQFGGSVQAYMGDGIAAFFGVPVAHEDDPDRAAHAGLQIVEIVAEYARDVAAAWGVEDFNVRVGINGGHMAVGAVGGAGGQLVTLGDATNVAARLQSTAAPGTIVVGEQTARRLAHRFLLEALGELQVKGRVEAVSAWRLAGPLDETMQQAPTPLVGRAPELARFRVAAEELLAGRGQLLLLAGDSGIGKTRLLGELATILGGQAFWLEGHPRPFGEELLYWPFAQILLSWLEAEAGEAEVAVRTKLRSKLSSLPSLDDATVSGLGALLGLRDGHDQRSRPRLDDVGTEIRVAYCRWIEALGARQPLVIVLDDFQWADGPTRELAQALLDLTDRAPLLLAVAYRGQPASEASHFRLHALEHYSHRTTDLALERLEESETSELLAMLLPDDFDPSAGAEVVARAEGNPLYVEELLRALIEDGGLERRNRTWALTRAPGRLVPAALEGLLLARIDQLPEEPRRLAQLAAVVGRTFPASVLARISPNEQLEQDISILLRAQVITELRRFPELIYSFKHGLLQECALSTLTPARREEMYGVVAAVFEDLYADAPEKHLDMLTSYYARSGNRAKALEYLELASQRAASLNANTEAVSLLTRALKIATELGDAQAEGRITTELKRLAAADIGAA